ncbi:hypothetical protein AHF37_07684 [Paragonimus kellicotti]|nr:hypothetical protein AHF37_07684 [Paragonimus kellicotti]
MKFVLTSLHYSCVISLFVPQYNLGKFMPVSVEVAIQLVKVLSSTLSVQTDHMCYPDLQSVATTTIRDPTCLSSDRTYWFISTF